MYRPPQFDWNDPPGILAFCRAHPFATVASAGADGDLEAQHLPLIVEAGPDAGGLVLYGHAAVSDPLWRADRALAVFHGPHAYVSAAWYAEPDTVPTWNYLAVHAQGPLSVLDASESDRLFAALVAAVGDPDAAAWQDRLSAATAARLTTAIRWFRIDARSVQAKAKLSQNHSATRRERVIARLAAGPDQAARSTGEAMARVLAGGAPWPA